MSPAPRSAPTRQDNDGDNLTDLADPECTTPCDDDESSYATGLPGDNRDATWQDCFFDGNSGAGNDGCNQHVCCLLQAGGATPNTNDDISECMALAPQSNYNQYNRAECYQPFGDTAVPSKCTMNCGPLTPPGCDCFGCSCTVCDDSGCADIILNPAVSPTCDQTNIADSGADGVDNTGDEPCKRCVKNTMSGSSECGGATCILCPGQTTLPPECTGGSTCPTGIMACDAMGACPVGTYCSNEAELFRLKGELLLAQSDQSIGAAEQCFSEALPIAQTPACKDVRTSSRCQYGEALAEAGQIGYC